ncbi:MAG: YCF48-related protein [Bacteroidota bacterium]
MQRNNLHLLWMLVVLAACQDPIVPVSTYIDSPAEPQDYLQRIIFQDPDTGYIVGGQRFDKTLVMRTVDGGENWEQLAMFDQFTFILFDVLTKENMVLGAGLGGLRLMSQDAGTNWSLRHTNGIKAIRSMVMIEDSVLIGVGGLGYNKGEILQSEDFGFSWTIVDTPEVELRDLHFSDDRTGYACGYGVVYKTKDGGDSWTLTPAKDDFFSSIHFPSPNVGYTVGRTGTILKTEDAGDSWEKLRNGNSPLVPRHLYNHVTFLDVNTGYILGDKGVFLKTTDGGLSWQTLDLDIEADLLHGYFFQEGEGLLVGSQGTIVRFRE